MTQTGPAGAPRSMRPHAVARITAPLRPAGRCAGQTRLDSHCPIRWRQPAPCQRGSCTGPGSMRGSDAGTTTQRRSCQITGPSRVFDRPAQRPSFTMMKPMCGSKRKGPSRGGQWPASSTPVPCATTQFSRRTPTACSLRAELRETSPRSLRPSSTEPHGHSAAPSPVRAVGFDPHTPPGPPTEKKKSPLGGGGPPLWGLGGFSPPGPPPPLICIAPTPMGSSSFGRGGNG